MHFELERSNSSGCKLRGRELDLIRALNGRTLWFLGFSMVWQLFASLRCRLDHLGLKTLTMSAAAHNISSQTIRALPRVTFSLAGQPCFAVRGARVCYVAVEWKAELRHSAGRQLDALFGLGAELGRPIIKKEDMVAVNFGDHFLPGLLDAAAIRMHDFVSRMTRLQGMGQLSTLLWLERMQLNIFQTKLATFWVCP